MKSDRDIEQLRVSGQILRAAFEHLEPYIKSGTATIELDQLADEFIRSQGAKPSFYRYNGFPGHICISVNEIVIHGIPDKRVLREGDLVSLDIGVNWNGFFTDSARTYGVGQITGEENALLRATEESLAVAVENLTLQSRIKDIGKSVSGYIKPFGYGIVDQFCGHGVGFAVHEDPSIFNCYPSPGMNPRLKPGMVLAIEPMICLGTHEVEILDDHFTVVTADGKKAAHFEHTIAVLRDRIEILT